MRINIWKLYFSNKNHRKCKLLFMDMHKCIKTYNYLMLREIEFFDVVYTKHILNVVLLGISFHFVIIVYLYADIRYSMKCPWTL